MSLADKSNCVPRYFPGGTCKTPALGLSRPTACSRPNLESLQRLSTCPRHCSRVELAKKQWAKAAKKYRSRARAACTKSLKISFLPRIIDHTSRDRKQAFLDPYTRDKPIGWDTSCFRRCRSAPPSFPYLKRVFIDARL